MKRFVVLFCTLFIFIISCVTYGPYTSMRQYGYSDSRLDENIFRISYIGAQNQPEAEVFDFLINRCAELTLQYGYDYFIMEEEERYQKETKGTIITPNPYLGLIAMGYTNQQITLVTRITCGKGKKPDTRNAFDALNIVKYSKINK